MGLVALTQNNLPPSTPRQTHQRQLSDAHMVPLDVFADDALCVPHPSTLRKSSRIT